jgi:T4-like virus tail tube protein gp19
VPADRAADAAKTRPVVPGPSRYRAKYSTVKLARAACADTETIKAWLAKVSFEHEHCLITIELFGHGDSSSPIVTWELNDPLPALWSVGGVGVDAGKVAIETVEIDHLGFLGDE